MTINHLYFVVIPMIHASGPSYGLTEQVLTLLPDKESATEFYKDELQEYINLFENRAKRSLSGGHVLGYTLYTEDAGMGRFIVRVDQRVE
jgi:hypothetical protein